MIRRDYLGTSILVLAFAMTASAAAFANNSHKLTLRHDVMLKATHLEPGEYTIRWDSHSPGATVTIAKKKNVVATVVRTKNSVRVELNGASGLDQTHRQESDLGPICGELTVNS